MGGAVETSAGVFRKEQRTEKQLVSLEVLVEAMHTGKERPGTTTYKSAEAAHDRFIEFCEANRLGRNHLDKEATLQMAKVCAVLERRIMEAEKKEKKNAVRKDS